MRLILSSQTKPESRAWYSYLLRVDMPLLMICVLLFVAGSFCVYIAAQGFPNFDNIWLRHIMALTIASSLMIFLSLLPSAHFAEFGKFIYAGALLTLILVLVAGKTIHGSRSWFVLGPIQFQPSEFSKMALILFISQMVVTLRQRDPILMAFSKLKIFFAIGFTMLLVLLQHDVSSSVGFLFIGLAYIWGLDIINGLVLGSLFCYGGLTFISIILHILAGLEPSLRGPWSHALEALGFGPGMDMLRGGLWMAAFTVLTSFAYMILRGLYVIPRSASWRWIIVVSIALWSSLMLSWTATKGLKMYQKNRLISFALPNADPLGSGYNITQSKIAIGSGGIFGRGIGLGGQTTLGFLPENHTDFAFSTLSETTGFIGAFTMIFLLGSLLWRLTRFMELARDEFGRLVALGFWGLWLGEVAINLACVLGLFPVMGVGLPFISYGGSRLVMNGISLGILLSVSRGFYVYR